MQDLIVLPPRAPATDEEIYKAATSILLARSHKHWRTLEERRRFWGGEIVEHRPPNLPTDAAPTFEVIREHRRTVEDIHDFVSNERLKDVFQRQKLSTIDRSWREARRRS